MVSIILNQSFIIVGLESQIKEVVGGGSFEGGNKKWTHVKQKLQLSFSFPKEVRQIAKPLHTKCSSFPSVILPPLNRVTYLYFTYLVRKQRQLINSARLRNQVIIISIIIIFRIIIIFIDYLQFYEADTIVICMYRFLKEIVLSNLPEILPLFHNNT